MPIKAIPKPVVKKLERIGRAKAFDKWLGERKIVDHRAIKLVGKGINFRETKEKGTRVRLAKLKIKGKWFEVVLKKMHRLPAKKVIEIINETVKYHNLNYAGEKRFRVVAPKAVVIAKDVVAMTRTNAPSIEEILGDNFGGGKTKRGQAQFGKIKKMHRTTEKQLFDMAKDFFDRTGIHRSNLLLLGADKTGKLVFMPLVDDF